MWGGSAAARLCSTLITAWVAARPPELSSTSTRSPAALEHRHLAELGVVVHARVGARVAGEDQAFFELDADAVGHGAEHTGQAATSSVQTLKLSSLFGPKVLDSATSQASRPRAISTRPMRGRVVARIEGVPAVAEIGLEPAREIHRSVWRLGADVAQVAGAIARRYVHAAAERDRQVRVVAAYAEAFVVGLPRRCVCCVHAGSRTRCAGARNRRSPARAPSRSEPSRTAAMRSRKARRSRNSGCPAGRPAWTPAGTRPAPAGPPAPRHRARRCR